MPFCDDLKVLFFLSIPWNIVKKPYLLKRILQQQK